MIDEEKLLDAIRDILLRGGNVEIKQKSDGSITIYEVKKNKLVMSIGT